MDRSYLCQIWQMKTQVCVNRVAKIIVRESGQAFFAKSIYQKRACKRRMDVLLKYVAIS